MTLLNTCEGYYLVAPVSLSHSQGIVSHASGGSPLTAGASLSRQPPREDLTGHFPVDIIISIPIILLK